MKWEFLIVSRKAILHLEAIGKTNILWRGQCRVDGITPDITKLDKDAGCITMCLRVEFVSQTSLDIINKRIKIERARETISLLKNSGIETRIYMIMGVTRGTRGHCRANLGIY